MRYRATMTIALASALTITGAIAAPAGEGGRKFETNLTGAVEVPGPGDPDGSGTAILRVNPGQLRICYELTVENIAPATAAHIHEAEAGAAGPVVVPLEAPTDGDSAACATVTRQLALEIIKDPHEYYVNVHNAEFEPGAVRGQLSKK